MGVMLYGLAQGCNPCFLTDKGGSIPSTLTIVPLAQLHRATIF